MDFWLTTLFLVAELVGVSALCIFCGVGLALWDHGHHGRKDWTQDHDY